MEKKNVAAKKENFTRCTMTGNYAAAEAMRQVNPEVVAAYPITPQSETIERFAEFVADGIVDTEFITVESEHSAMSACVGASAAGVRTMTATSSQGLALMWEVLGAASGLRLPVVMSVSNRALSSPLNIHCDHSDSMGARDSGWIQIFSENPQEVYENLLLAVKLSEAASLPVMVMQDGYVTSHCLENVRIYDDSEVKKFLGERKAPNSLLDIKNPVTIGPVQLTDYYFETKMQEADAMEKSKKAYLDAGKELSKITGNEYPLFEKFMLDDADAVLVVSSSTAGIAKDAIQKMRAKGKKVGMLKIKLYRPFPSEEIKKALAGKQIGVLDRSIAFGSSPPLFADVKTALCGSKPKIQAYVFGLGGRDIYEKDIEKIFEDLLAGKICDETAYVGVRE